MVFSRSATLLLIRYAAARGWDPEIAASTIIELYIRQQVTEARRAILVDGPDEKRRALDEAIAAIRLPEEEGQV